jgi:hypothetical protein
MPDAAGDLVASMLPPKITLKSGVLIYHALAGIIEIQNGLYAIRISSSSQQQLGFYRVIGITDHVRIVPPGTWNSPLILSFPITQTEGINEFRDI